MNKPAMHYTDVAKAAMFDELVDALRRATPWLGKMIADGAHMNSVAPNDCIGALQQAEHALARAKTLQENGQ